MVDSGDDPKLGAREGGRQLGDQLLASVCLASPLAGEIAIEPRHMAGPVAQLVELGASDVFGAAALGTLINVGVATTEDPQITYSGIGAISRDPVDQAIQDGVQRSASTVTNRVVDRGLAIPPTIRVQAGARISVVVTQRTAF